MNLLAKKLGMSRVFCDRRGAIAVTLFEVDSKLVAKSVDGNVVRLDIGFGAKKPVRVKKPQRQIFAKAGIEPPVVLRSFSVDKAEFEEQEKTIGADAYKLGQNLKPSIFSVGQKVDVRGKTIGKGFAGGMKRHNFGGLEATHGVSVSHRSHGSTGQCQDPGRVFKGKKMAGRMGGVNITKQNLEVVYIDDASKVIAIKGSVPGKPGAILQISKAIKIKKKKEVK